MDNNGQLMSCQTLDEHLDADGKPRTTEREQFDANAAAFCLAETPKEERLKAILTQQQLAKRIGTKKSMSRVWETAKPIFSSTLYIESSRVLIDVYL